MLHLLLALAATLSTDPAASAGSGSDELRAAPRITETHVYRIRQTVKLADVPADAREVRLWVPVPADGDWQRVLDRKVIEAPSGWTLEKQPVSNAEMVVVKTKPQGSVQVVVETTVMRQSPAYDLAAIAAAELQPALFTEELRKDSPLMAVDAAVSVFAKKACVGETDTVKKVLKLLDAVADAADHYSKDATKPSSGRGAAADCLANGGGGCTDLHSLFVAAARAEGIPARIQFGYRVKPDKENTEYDPSYRCWVEFYVPNAGWIPTDIVVSDAGEPSARKGLYGTLDARRVWLWQGRSLELVPRQSGGPIETMSCGWAEIDGKPVDVLPAADGSPSKLSRKIQFQELKEGAK